MSNKKLFPRILSRLDEILSILRRTENKREGEVEPDEGGGGVHFCIAVDDGDNLRLTRARRKLEPGAIVELTGGSSWKYVMVVAEVGATVEERALLDVVYSRQLFQWEVRDAVEM